MRTHPGRGRYAFKLVDQFDDGEAHEIAGTGGPAVARDEAAAGEYPPGQIGDGK